MQGKFRFSLDGVDATARQFAEVRRQLQEVSASVRGNISRLVDRLATVENDAVVVPDHGGTGVRNVFANQLSSTPRKPVYCLYDGTLGVDCSSAHSVTNVRDADEFIPVDALRRVKWQIFTMKDDENQHLDNAQAMVGMIADDLEKAGLGFFCEYDEAGELVGINYPMLSVAALRLAQQAMDEVDRLKGMVAEDSSGGR